MTDTSPHIRTPSDRGGEPRRVRHVEAIANGTVIDHIPSAATLKVARLISGPDDQVFIGINLRSKSGPKGVVKIDGRELTAEAMGRLAVVAPAATVNIIRGYRVVEKGPVPLPDAIVGIARCPNGNCITNAESCMTRFAVLSRSPLRARCTYCEREFAGDDLVIE